MKQAKGYKVMVPIDFTINGLILFGTRSTFSGLWL